jgi:adenosylcobinamide amidohydrolase
MKEQIYGWGYPTDTTIGLQTAAHLTKLSVQEEVGDEFRLVCCATAGTSNATRAGYPRKTFSSYQFGTINLFILIDGRLSDVAMVNSIMTATEAKSAVLHDLGIQDTNNKRIATGTTTDAIVISVSRDERFYHEHMFAGTATTIGNAIGRLVYQSIYEILSNQVSN